MKMKYRHTSINARDWKKLSAFYQNVFGCVPLRQRRSLGGAWFEKLTGIEGARAEGEHLRLPGYEDDNPCLEILTYEGQIQNEAKAINCQTGYAHLCFEVDDVEETFALLKAEGGSANGKIVTRFYPELDKTAHLIYAKDPDGNNVEILCWSDFKERYPDKSCVYRHTNINGVDWQRIVTFYEQVFGCIPVFPARDLSGDWFDDVTGVKGAALKGQHVEVPGYAKPPTLEVFTYANAVSGPAKAVNETGVAHVCFEVEDVHAVYNRILAAGGSAVGSVVSEHFSAMGQTLNAAYMKDPDGNILELSCWK